MIFAGLTDWFEVFKIGTWTDAAGNTRKWTEADLDTIIANYNPREEEAPLVIGHPDTDPPAWGWVDGLKRVGGVLLAKAKDVVQEFEEMVKQGQFKNRSVRLSPDGARLLHIGFLGAAAPAVKGLGNVSFNLKKGGAVMDFEFGQNSPGEELSEKTKEILKNPAKYGRDELTFSEAFEIAQKEYPELTRAYADYLFDNR
jgi:hypothetical protein